MYIFNNSYYINFYFLLKKIQQYKSVYNNYRCLFISYPANYSPKEQP